jgi:hypothetical protein
MLRTDPLLQAALCAVEQEDEARRALGHVALNLFRMRSICIKRNRLNRVGQAGLLTDSLNQ